jgi:hypothetical protein
MQDMRQLAAGLLAELAQLAALIDAGSAHPLTHAPAIC